MRRTLFTIPGIDWPLPSFGLCLVAGILSGTWLAARLAQRDGIAKDHIHDFMLPLMALGILGARLFYVLQFRAQFQGRWLDALKIWEGGLVVYGSALGMMIAVLWHCWRRGLPLLRFLDVLAPAFALGLAFGRLGCFLNGCCFGDAGGPCAVQYPAASDQAVTEVHRGLRTPLGFGTEPGRRPGEPRRVAFVEPGSPAQLAGVSVGDDILAINGNVARDELDFRDELRLAWGRLVGPRAPGTPLTLDLSRGGLAKAAAFGLPRPAPSHPTQLYMAAGNLLLLLLLLAHRPLRTRPGQTIGLMLAAYAVGRFVVEFVRADETPYSNGLTISQNLSLPVFAIGALLLLWPRRNPA